MILFKYSEESQIWDFNQILSQKMGSLCHYKQNTDSTISSRAKLKEKKKYIKKQSRPLSMKRADFQIHYVRLNKVEELQEGSFGKSCLVHHKLTKEQFIMKIIPKRKLESFGISVQKNPEIKLCSPYIVKALGCFTTGAYFYIISQYVQGTNLAEEISSLARMKEQVVQRIAAQILLALQQFHSKSIIYRNLTPSRVMINQDYKVKLVNFGIHDFILQPSGMKFGTFSEDYFYKSPEHLREEQITFASDIWQLGVCIYEMLTGKRLFNKQDRNIYRQEVLQASLDLPEKLSTEAASLLIKMLCKDPSLRPGVGASGMKELKSHQFFSKVNWKEKENKLNNSLVNAQF